MQLATSPKENSSQNFAQIKLASAQGILICVSLRDAGKENPSRYRTWYAICLRIYQTQMKMKKDSYFP